MNPQSSSTTKRTSPVRTLLRLLITAIVIGGAFWIVSNRQALSDWVLLQSYTPPTAISALAANMQVTNKGKDAFYVSKPELRGKDTFSQACSGLDNEHGNVLGCYNGSKIYIFDVAGDQLKGIEEVTAAHEMLHAAYTRLSNGDLKELNAMLEKQKQQGLNEDIKQSLVLYEKSEPGQELNELHSMLGSQQAQLLPELEAYYKKYFEQRSAVVAYAKSYQATFSNLTKQQDLLKTEIDTLATEINTDTLEINALSSQLKQDIDSFNSKANTGGFDSQDTFNQQRNELMERQITINERINANTSMRSEYTSKIAEYNALGIEYNKLNDTINSGPTQLEESL